MHRHPYQDPELSPEKRADNLLSLMTLEEKVGQLIQHNFMGTQTELIEEYLTHHTGSYLDIRDNETLGALQRTALQSRLGIPILFELDSVHGNCFVDGAVVFPSQMLMGSAWNRELMREMGEVVRRESLVTGMKLSYSPTLCLAHEPRWGRYGECFGEDPYHVGELAAEEIKGMQAGEVLNRDSLCANIKHYAGYGASIGGRDSFESGLTKRRLHDYYLHPFEKAVKAGVGSVMAGYHSNDGVPCSADRWLLTDVLRLDFGFDGVVITDWDNLGHMLTNQRSCETMDEAVLLGLLAGNDVFMSTPDFADTAIRLVKEGRIPESVVDECSRRVLLLKFRLGLFEDPCLPDDAQAAVTLGCPEHIAVCRELSDQGIILLKNEDELLPYDFSGKTVGLVGPNADSITAQLGDWSFGNAWATHEKTGRHPDTITVRKALEACVAGKQDFTLSLFPESFSFDMAEGLAQSSDDELRACDIFIAAIGDTMSFYGECKDRVSLRLPGTQTAALERISSLGIPVIAVLIHSKPIGESWLKDKANAVLDAWNPGYYGGDSIVKIITGEVNPSGRLTVSLPYESGQAPIYYGQMPGWHTRSEGSEGPFGYIDLPTGPMWPFGFGLSYTSFKYHELVLDNRALSPHEPVSGSVLVENTGSRSGLETIQFYVADRIQSHVRESKRLKAFEKVSFEPGERKSVRFSIPFSELALVTRDLVQVVEKGDFVLSAGSSSEPADCLQVAFSVTETVEIRRFR